MARDPHQAHFLRQFFRNDPSPALIGIADLSGFQRRALLERHVQGGWAGLGGFDIGEVVVWSNGRGDRELWVRPCDKTSEPDDTYARAWRCFDGRAAPPGTVIDHLYPETAAARFAMAYVRLLPVDAAANRRTTHLEKVLAKADYGTRDHTADYFAAVKAMGYLGRITLGRTPREIAADIIAHAEQSGAPVPPEWSNPALRALEVEQTASKLQRIRDEWARQQQEKRWLRMLGRGGRR